MKMRFLTTMLFFFVSGIVSAGGKQDIPVSDATFALGTVCTVTVYEDIDGFSFDIPFALIDEIHETMSSQEAGSEVSAINEAAGKQMVYVSDGTFEVIREGVDYGLLSDGKFDITVWPLVDLWGIGYEWQRVPDPEEITQTLSLVDYRDVVLDEERSGVFLKREGMAIDLGGIAKGYASDVVRDLLVDLGFTRGILNFGGNVLTFGTKISGEPWRVGVQNPNRQRGEYLGVLETGASAVVTSGVYERYFERDGVRYHHILDTSTGAPVVNELLGVTVLSPSGIAADAYSTIVFALGLEEGMSLVERTPDLEAVFILNTNDIYLSTGVGDSFLLSDDRYRVK